jgi:hypothetical protein
VRVGSLMALSSSVTVIPSIEFTHPVNTRELGFRSLISSHIEMELQSGDFFFMPFAATGNPAGGGTSSDNR